ncbi:MAG TPA: hypothetical protein VL523_04565 [Terriglobia bacterium]|nr:hypothetical protein [Terriglobia bacterium]
MPETVLKHVLQYAGYGLEVTLLITLVMRGYTRSLTALVAYVVTLFGADAVVRPWALFKYGQSSREYFNAYWLTDLLLVFATFLLICAFFRRACHQQGPRSWPFVWPVLVSSLVMVAAVSGADFRHHYPKLFKGNYIWEFNQNLGFTCLVLTTVLYVMLQGIKKKDGQLQLLVCGLGIQFAGPTANCALVHLTAGSQGPVQLLTYFSPVCSLAMLGIWLYAVAHERRAIRQAPIVRGRRVPVAA